MSPDLIELYDPTTSRSLLILRPRWPYRLGAIAGPLLGLCVLLALAAPWLPGRSVETAAAVAQIGIVLAELLLGIAWIGVLRAGQGGAGPIAGSFAYPLVLAYLSLDREHDPITILALLIGAFAAFAWGHAAAPLGALGRGFAVVTATLWSVLFVAVLKQWAVPEAIQILAMVALALTGIGLAASFLWLRYAAPRDA